MKKQLAILGSSLVLGTALLSGCAANGQPTPSGVGTVVGAVGGGLIGAGLSGGNTAATIGGTVVGGFIGNRVGKSYEQRRAYCVQYRDGRCVAVRYYN